MPDKAVTVRLLLSAAVVLGLVGCDRSEQPRPAAAPEQAPAVASAPEPAVDPVLDRAAILAAIDAAASDTALGRVTPSTADPLAGRRFRMRISFGCAGPVPEPSNPVDGVPGWSRSGDGQTVRLRFTPADWTDGGPAGPPVEGFETIGGVWINQPWIRTGDCPAGTASTAAPPSPVAGLALLRADGASRLGRDDSRAFAYTLRGDGAARAPDPVRGYRLVLEGRLTPWAGSRVIRCATPDANTRPVCVAGVVIDHLAYEDGATGETLGEWRPG